MDPWNKSQLTNSEWMTKRPILYIIVKPQTPGENIKLPSTKEVNSAMNKSQQDNTKVSSPYILKIKKEKISCEICNITFSTDGSRYKRHMLKHTNHYAFQCDVCAKKFKYKHNLNSHKKIHSETPFHSCQYCDFSTTHSSYLRVHFRRKHSNDFQFKCDKCDRQFRVKPDYTKHMITHEKNQCICDVCGMTLPNKISFYFHKHSKHILKDSKFECPMCKKKLRNQKNLDSHVQHHQQRYMCEECGMKLTRKASLKRHIKTHSREKSHLCHICGKTFTSATSRKVHLLTHSEIRSYLCTICGQSFMQRSTFCIHCKKEPPNITANPLSVLTSTETINHSDAKTVDV